MKDLRVLSGMRPTGQMHLGHYHGVLKNWIGLQNEYDSYYFVADWHAFTTHYSDNIDLESNVSNMVVDWLATGINPNTSTIFVQSKVPEHAELPQNNKSHIHFEAQSSFLERHDSALNAFDPSDASRIVREDLSLQVIKEFHVNKPIIP